MMYLFYGTDTERVRRKAFEWIAKAREKEPNLVYIRLAREDLTEPTLQSVEDSGTLFAKRLLVLLDDPFPLTRSSDEEDENIKQKSSTAIIDSHLTAIVDSENVFVIVASKLPATKSKSLTTKAKLSYRFDTSPSAKSTPVRGFNSALVNALAARSQTKVWLEIVRALRAGDTPEMLHGLLHWKARELMEKGSKTWSPEEARALSLALITLLQHARRMGRDLSISLEQFALSI